MVATVHWEAGMEKPSDTKIGNLEVDPLPVGTLAIRPTAVGQSVLVRFGTHARLQGRIVKISGPKYTVQPHEDAATGAVSVDGKFLHVVSNADGRIGTHDTEVAEQRAPLAEAAISKVHHFIQTVPVAR